jgi:hypothetical protein
LKGARETSDTLPTVPRRSMKTWLPRLISALLVALPSGGARAAQIAIRCGHLIDGVRLTPIDNAVILVEGERIKGVGVGLSIPPGAQVIDLGTATVLPGLIDSHTHVLLEGDITAADYDSQLLQDSIPFRTIRATVAARAALQNGFTTIRDLETEGAMYADVDVKKAVNQGLIPGPRMFVATRAMAPTGMYPLLGYSWELRVPEGVQIVDGPDAIRRAVREQVKYGADWIKYYSDRGYFMKDGALRSRVNFTDDEANALYKKHTGSDDEWQPTPWLRTESTQPFVRASTRSSTATDSMRASWTSWCAGASIGAPRSSLGPTWPKDERLRALPFGRRWSRSWNRPSARP